MRASIMTAAAIVSLGLWGCAELEFPALEDKVQAQGVGPIQGERGEAPDLDLVAWCTAQMARDPDPCTLCADHIQACTYTCTEPDTGRVVCGPLDADRCAFAEEHCARCELCAAYAPPPQAEALPMPDEPADPGAVPIDPNRFNVDLKPETPTPPARRAIPDSPLPGSELPTPEPPPCGVPDGPFDD